MADRKVNAGEPTVSGRPSRRGFHVALGVYVVWLIFLAVLVLMQRTL